MRGDSVMSMVTSGRSSTVVVGVDGSFGGDSPFAAAQSSNVNFFSSFFFFLVAGFFAW